MMARRLPLVLILGALLLLAPSISAPALARAQDQSSEAAQQSPPHKSVAGELANEERAAMGEEEENQNLKHSTLIKKFAHMTGMTDHQAHMLALVLNFALVIFLIYWFGRKFVPGALRNRTASIQRALEEARAASADARRRLSEIEARLQKLDSEVTQMQAAAEKESESEETRIKAAAEEDIRKVVEAAQQEIAAAGKQARRELTSHTAELAVALARKQIQVDPATDQVLVRNFAGKLSSENGGKDRA